MGCCMQNLVEIKRLDIVINETPEFSYEKSNFIEISLTSNNEGQEEIVDDWIKYKGANAKSLTDSFAMISTLIQSERKCSIYSKPGSLVDSFTVNLLMHKTLNSS